MRAVTGPAGGTVSEAAAALRVQLAANQWLGAPEDATGSPVDLVIPIHNARHHLERCIEAVALRTDFPFRLILINDGSTDPDVSTLLTALRGASGLVVIDRAENLGFVHTANEGLAFSGTHDVVLLNSDTVVSQGWLGGLRRVAHVRPDVATVTPLTNNGTLCSVPTPFQDNHIPVGYDVDTFSALVATTSLRLYPEVPTGVGFCLFITRCAIRLVGLFDTTTFGRGYGEENDFCQRALSAGLVNLIADDVFVFHEGGASFGADRDPLLAPHLVAVRDRYPNYDAAVETILREHPLREFHAYLNACIDARRTAAEMRDSLRVLHLLHEGGGTEKHARELAQTPDRNLSNFVSTSDGKTLFVDEYFAGLRLRRLMLPLQEPIDPEDPRPVASYRAALRTTCAALGIQILHIHHLRNNTVDVVDVGRDLGISLVLTIHDYHLVCPSYTLLRPDGQPCGACLTPEAEGDRVNVCLTCRGHSRQFLDVYQAVMSRVLDAATHIVVPSTSARHIVSRRYPQVEQASVIEHGHRADIVHTGTSDQRRDRELRIAVLGGLDVHKGRDVLRGVLRGNRLRASVFHLYGTTSDPELSGAPIGRETIVDGSRFVNHGPYTPGEIVAHLRADAIHVGLHLSIWPETFSFTLSEFAAAGVPVVAGRLGAQGDRTEAHALGWTLPDIADVARVLELLSELARSPARLAAARTGMRSRDALRPLRAMWDDYAALYRNTWETRMPVNEPHTSPDVSGYLASVAARLAGEHDAHERTRGDLHRAHDEIQRLEALLRSPRHRVATMAATALQRIPVVWPIIARVTDAVIARRRTGATTQPPEQR